MNWKHLYKFFQVWSLTRPRNKDQTIAKSYARKQTSTVLLADWQVVLVSSLDCDTEIPFCTKRNQDLLRLTSESHIRYTYRYRWCWNTFYWRASEQSRTIRTVPKNSIINLKRLPLATDGINMSINKDNKCSGRNHSTVFKSMSSKCYSKKGHLWRIILKTGKSIKHLSCLHGTEEPNSRWGEVYLYISIPANT